MGKIAAVLSCAEGRIITALLLVMAAALAVLVYALNESFYFREDVFVDDCD